MSFEDFARFADGVPNNGPAIPVIGLAQAGDEGFFDDSGFPKGVWDDVRVLGLQSGGVYALQIAGDSMSPVLHAGDKILVAPNESVRKSIDGEVMPKNSINRWRIK